MNTTEDTNISEQEANHIDSPDNDNGKTQQQIDSEHADVVQAKTAQPTSESDIQPGREAVDGNGQREIPDYGSVQAGTVLTDNATTEHAKHVQSVQDKERHKLGLDTKKNDATQ